MNRMWLPATTPVTAYDRYAVTIGGHDWDTTVAPGWVDVDTYPMLEQYCITEMEYKLKRLTGEVIL